MSIFSFFSTMFNKALSAFKSFFEAALPQSKQIILGLLKDIAMQAVSEMDVTTMTNEEKRNAAFKKIANYAMLKGIDARSSLINLAIELAVQAIKDQL